MISEKAIWFRHPDYDPDRAQKLISSSMSRHLSTRNISFKSMHVFLSNLANRQTDRQTWAKTFTSSFVGGKNTTWVQIQCVHLCKNIKVQSLWKSWVCSSGLNLESTFLLDCSSSRDRPNLFISSLTPSHHGFLRCPFGLVLSTSIAVRLYPVDIILRSTCQMLFNTYKTVHCAWFCVS